MSARLTLHRMLLAAAALATVDVVSAAAATVSVSELTHCAAIVAVDQRLACYDTLAAAKMPPPAAPAAAKAAATGTAAATTAAASPAAAASPTTAAPAAAAGAGGFGMSTHTAPIEQATQQITAHVLSGSGDRLGNNFVALDNGQTWTYMDINGPAPNGSVVTIRRGTLGSYLLTTSMHHSFRAQRTK